jgi:hypothetical protein
MTSASSDDRARVAPEHERPSCGVVMPISALDGLGEPHWLEVREIFFDVLRTAGFAPGMVSQAQETTIIHKTIIHNLYSNPIVLCDVSGKNPNVMFELGLRLAFDKPTVVVKDDRTDYSFDTSPIEHLVYPRDLRFTRMITFREQLAERIRNTFEAGKKPDYSAFVRYFGQFVPARLEQTEIPQSEFVLRKLSELTEALTRLELNQRSPARLSEEEILMPDVVTYATSRLRTPMEVVDFSLGLPMVEGVNVSPVQGGAGMYRYAIRFHSPLRRQHAYEVRDQVKDFARSSSVSAEPGAVSATGGHESDD